MKEITARGCITDGKLLLDHRPWFDSQLPAWEGEPVIVTVRREGRRQSDAFRGWYWAEVMPALAAYMREEGDGEATPESAHEALGFKFLSVSPCPVTGAPRRRSTSPDVMSAEDFRAFVLDQVLPFLIRDCGLNIREPDPAKRSPRRVRQLQRRDELASGGMAAR